MRTIARWAQLFVVLGIAFEVAAADPLASWNDGAAKQAIAEFVAAVTKQGVRGFVPEASGRRSLLSSSRHRER